MSFEKIEILAFLVSSVLVIALLGTFLIMVILLNKKKQFEFQKNIEMIKAEHQNVLLNAQLEIQENTFKAIAREIHDNIGLILTLSKLNLNTIEFADQASAEKKISESIDLITQSISELSALSKNLNSEFIVEYGLIKAIENEVERLKNVGKYKVHFSVDGQTRYLEIKSEILIFRMVQEALQNIIKHSEASLIVIRMRYSLDHLKIIITDNGIGIRSELVGTTNGSGLRNIYQRAKLLKGRFDIAANEKRGTNLTITIPFNCMQ